MIGYLARFAVGFLAGFSLGVAALHLVAVLP